jgi:hypothetical protein
LLFPFTFCQALFGKKGTDFDFQGGRYQENKDRLEKLTTEQKKLSKNINKKASVHGEGVKNRAVKRRKKKMPPKDGMIQKHQQFFRVKRCKAFDPSRW